MLHFAFPSSLSFENETFYYVQCMEKKPNLVTFYISSIPVLKTKHSSYYIQCMKKKQTPVFLNVAFLSFLCFENDTLYYFSMCGKETNPSLLHFAILPSICFENETFCYIQCMKKKQTPSLLHFELFCISVIPQIHMSVVMNTCVDKVLRYNCLLWWLQTRCSDTSVCDDDCRQGAQIQVYVMMTADKVLRYTCMWWWPLMQTRCKTGLVSFSYIEYNRMFRFQNSGMIEMQNVVRLGFVSFLYIE